MKQKTSVLRWVKEIISEDHGGLEMSNKQGLGNQHKRKTKNLKRTQNKSVKTMAKLELRRQVFTCSTFV